MMIKKQWVMAVVLLLAIPVVLVLGGALFSFINPEIAAGHPNYVRNFHLLNLLKLGVMWATAAAVLVLWVLVCLQVIRAKKRSASWLVLAALGPFGLAVLAMLNDAPTNELPINEDSTGGRASAVHAGLVEIDRYARFVRSLNGFVRVGYELCTFVIVWVLAYQGMVLKRTLMIRFEAVRSGLSVAQVIDLQNASGGMWAFAEGLEVTFFVVLLYLLRPLIFSAIWRVAAAITSSRAS
jgi:hypothetical protein